jgi:alkylation response protein AidB-like acyl-CoA dehydrogenase
MLRDVTREFLTEQCPPEHARRMFDDPIGYDPKTYRRMAELGLLGLPFPEEYGGAGLGMVDLAVVLEEMGRVAYPGAVLRERGPGGRHHRGLGRRAGDPRASCRGSRPAR